jgi:DNA-binding XRE family transcriptional regulator
MTKNFNTLREKRSAGAQKRACALAAKYRAEMALDELREAREMTQNHLAKILGINQAAVSKMERRTDMYVSTLCDFIRTMGGGKLEIVAKFPGGNVRIDSSEVCQSVRRTIKRRPSPPIRDLFGFGKISNQGHGLEKYLV